MLAGGKDKIDFHLNPRNLGKMRISLIVQKAYKCPYSNRNQCSRTVVKQLVTTGTDDGCIQ